MPKPVSLRELLSLSTLWLALPVLVATAACEDSVSGPGADEFDLQPGYALLSSGAEITLGAEADVFQPGAPVTLVLENHSGDQIGFNLCFHVLERQDGEDWIMEEDGRICTAHLNLLESGHSADYSTSLPEELVPGHVYRFRVALYLLDEQGHRDQVSQSFEVQS